MRAVCLGLLFSMGCMPAAEKPTAQIPFEDDFNRASLGDHWYPSGGVWRIRDGQVESLGTNNAPLFLRARLPADVVVEVDATSETSQVDMKLELMTDGLTHSSGYVFIFGGWKNSLSAIARLDEHGANRAVKKPSGVSGPRSYHWRIEKKGGSLAWFVDGQPYLSFEDPKPLDGPGHDRLAFGNWQNRIHFDNLKVWPFESAPPRP